MPRLDIPATLPREPTLRLRACGAALYGGRWQTGLALALGVARTTIVRWNNDSVEIPTDLDERLAAACRARAIEVRREAEKMLRLARYLEKSGGGS